MEAFEVVRLFVNKTVVPREHRRQGNPGYGALRAVRLLVYSRQVGMVNDTRIVEHLKRRPEALRGLGFRSVPDRTTVGRWWRRYADLLEEVFEWFSRLVRMLAPTRLLIVDSTPLVDLYDLGGLGLHRARPLQRLQAPRSGQPVWASPEGKGHGWEQV